MAAYQKAWTIVVFFFFLNAVPGLLLASGVSADMGIDPAVSGGEQIDQANNAMDDIEPSGGFASTLFTLYTSVTGPIKTVLELLLGGELMLISLGVPGWLVGFIFSPKYLLLGAGVIYVLAGRRL